MARGDCGETRRAKSAGFGAVPLGFATNAPRGSAGSFTSLPIRHESALDSIISHRNRFSPWVIHQLRVFLSPFIKGGGQWVLPFGVFFLPWAGKGEVEGILKLS